MKIALLQVQLDTRGGAANVQCINAAIDRAADIDSAPDLLVLPGGCDAGGSASKLKRGLAALEGVRESIAFKAREWGVYIVAGLHSIVDDKLIPCSMLFDSDGDRLGSSLTVANEESQGCPGIQTYATPMGLIGVADATSKVDLAEWECNEDRVVVVAIPVAATLSASARRRAEDQVCALRSGRGTGRGLYWAVVASADNESAGKTRGSSATFVSDSEGQVLAEADQAGECIVYLDVPIVGNPS